MLPNASIVVPPTVKKRNPRQFFSKQTFTPRSIKVKDVFVQLLIIHYDPLLSTIDQLFKVPDNHWATNIVFHSVVVEILENWGGQTTCFYCLKIHGQV